MASELLSAVREEIRRRNYSYKTEQAYIRRIVRFVKFHDLEHPKKMGERHVVHFLNWLANERQVAASTQNQALCGLVFLYDSILNKPLGKLNKLKRAKESNHIPVVLSQDETRRIISKMDGLPKLMVELLYGSGLRQSECLRLRVNDLDFEFNQVWVRNSKGSKDRTTIMPQTCKRKLRGQIKKVVLLHKRDKEKGFGEVVLPNALSRKYPAESGKLA